MNGLFVCLMLLSAGQVVSLPTVQEIEARMFRSRATVKRGELVIDSHDIWWDRKGRLGLVSGVNHVWFDGDKVRHDKLFTSDAGNEARRITCLNCPATGEFIRCDLEPNKHAKTGMQDGPIPANDRNNPWYRVLNPRHLGHVANSFESLRTFGPGVLFGRADRKNYSVAADTWRGQDCYRLGFELESGCAVRVWVVPAWDYNVVKIEGELSFEGVQNYALAEFEVGEFDGIWFPTQSKFEKKENGTLTQRFVEPITVVSLNRPIDPKVFGFAGMDIPPNQPIGPRPGSSDYKLWDGTKTVPLPASKLQARPSVIADASPLARYRGWLWGASGVAGAAAAYALWRLWRRPT